MIKMYNGYMVDESNFVDETDKVIYRQFEINGLKSVIGYYPVLKWYVIRWQYHKNLIKEFKISTEASKDSNILSMLIKRLVDSIRNCHHEWIALVDHENGNFYHTPIKEICKKCRLDKPTLDTSSASPEAPSATSE